MDALLVLLILTPVVFGTPVTLLHRQARNANSELLPSSHNACEDPDPNRVGDDGTELEITDLPEFLQHVKDESLYIRDNLMNGTEHMERRVHCPNIVNGMRDLDITNFVTIETAMAEYQNDVTRRYFEVRQVLYMFEVLLSPQLEMCCLDMSRYHDRLNNRLMGKWFILYSQYGQGIQDAHCCLSGTVEINRHLTCELIRDLSYTILKEGIATINSSIDFLQNWINGID